MWQQNHFFFPKSNEFLISFEQSNRVAESRKTKWQQRTCEIWRNRWVCQFISIAFFCNYPFLSMLFLFAWIASLNTGCVPFNPLTVFNHFDCGYKTGTMCRQSFGFGPNATHSSGKNSTVWWWSGGQCFCDGSARIGDWSETWVSKST